MLVLFVIILSALALYALLKPPSEASEWQETSETYQDAPLGDIQAPDYAKVRIMGNEE